jgi:hypothetical protein
VVVASSRRTYYQPKPGDYSNGIQYTSSTNLFPSHLTTHSKTSIPTSYTTYMQFNCSPLSIQSTRVLASYILAGYPATVVVASSRTYQPKPGDYSNGIQYTSSTNLFPSHLTTNSKTSIPTSYTTYMQFSFELHISLYISSVDYRK